MAKVCRACEIAANDELVKQMPMHTCGKDGPMENADALKTGMKEQDAAHSFEEILNNKIWTALKETEFCASHRPAIDKLKNVVYEYAAQELDAYKARLKEAISEDYKVTMLRSQGLRTVINVDSVYQLIDKL